MPNSRLTILVKSLRQLGIKPLALLAIYRFGIISGHYRRVTPPGLPLVTGMKSSTRLNLEQVGPLHIPTRSQLETLLDEAGKADAISRAEEVVSGQVRLFGGDPRPIDLAPAGPLLHWTEYKSTLASPNGWEDIKFTWEQGRLGWIYPLARAYALTGDERYPETFWKYLEEFLAANPANQGPNWSSAQEVSIRLLGMIFAGQTFSASSHTTEDRLQLLSLAIETHAARIPPTLVYARAQNNNHLITEALGILTAGWALPGHPSAKGWVETGWRWLTWALESQVADDGTYIQYSTNYHRLMLQAALWAQSLLKQQGKSLPPAICQRLAAAAHWLFNRMDPESGGVINYGANDGAYLFPLAGGEWRDFRPVIQAAGYAFTGGPLLPAGAWDEMSQWFGVGMAEAFSTLDQPVAAEKDPARLEDPASQSWARLNAVHYSARPSHADQLHVDLWWKGIPITSDAGTYLYNADPPWNNSLAGAAFHNTTLINDQDQMLHAGRFLWLDWAQGRYLAPLTNQNPTPQISAEHDGYDSVGVRHIRTLTLLGAGRWMVQDSLVPSATPRNTPYKAVLHWLLPDWQWQIASTHLMLHGPPGRVEIEIRTEKTSRDRQIQPVLGLARAGVLIAGRGTARPQHGWFSVIYGEKLPALSLLAQVESVLPVEISTTFNLSVENHNP